MCLPVLAVLIDVCISTNHVDVIQGMLPHLLLLCCLLVQSYLPLWHLLLLLLAFALVQARSHGWQWQGSHANT